MSNFKRTIALLLALVMVLSMLPVRSTATETQPETEVDTGDVTIEGSNGFGNLLSDAITEKQESESEEASEYEAGYTVTDLEIEGNTAIVTYDSMEEAILIVALYSEDGMQMLTSAKTTVMPDATEATVTFEGTMPEYFLASAYLVDVYDLSPLCAAYDTPLYTQEMQELLASTVDDYDPELVLNLDESEDTNFAVYAQTTKIIDYVEGFNIVASADEETATYVIENADEQFTSLAAGDVFAYGYGENEILIAKIATITVEGTTVTITGAEVEMEEVFSHVKIDGEGDSNDVTIDDSTAAEGVVYQQEARSGQICSTNSQDANEEEVKKSISISFEGVKLGGDALNVSLTGGAKLELSLKIKYYITWSYQRIEVRLATGLEGSVALSLAAEGKIPLGVFCFELIPGILVAGWDLNFVVKFEAKIEATFKVGLEFGVIIDHGEHGWDVDPYFDPDVDVEAKAEGKVFLGLELDPLIEVAYGVLAEIKLSAEGGAEATLSQDIFEEESDEEIHECNNCFEGDLKVVFHSDVSAKFLKMEKLSIKETLKDFSHKVSDLYWSVDYDEFGWSLCPHRAYKLTVQTVDENKTALQGANVTAADQSGQTDENGYVEFYIPAGSYRIQAAAGELSAATTIYVDEARILTLTLKEQGSGSSDESDGGGIDWDAIFGDVESEEITDPGVPVASGTCGENVTWELYSNGLLKISGEGAMGRYGLYSRPWDTIQSSIQKVEIADGVTTIGCYAFYSCKNLTSVTIPDSVTSIEDCAFSHCASLTDVTIPDSVATIEWSVFEFCSSLTSVSIPDSVKSIEGYAFSDCFSLSSVTIPDSVTAIGEYAFYYCKSLSSVTIPDSVTAIGEYAFSHCDSLEGIYASATNSYYSSDSRGVLFDKNKTVLIQAPGAITGDYAIPGSVTTIEQRAFSYCDSLTSVTIPDSVTTIEQSAFNECDSLTRVTIGNSVTTIGPSAFMYCASLTSVTIPDSVVTIGTYAFSWGSLTSVTFEGNAPEFGSDVFLRVTANAYYPAGDSTWTSDVMQNYGGTITWVPYTRAENGNMVTNATAAVTVSAPLEVESTMNAALEAPSMPDFVEEEEAAAPDAVYGGEYSTEITDTYTLKNASFTGLVPEQQYVLLAMKSIETEDSLSADNLLFIDQAAAGEDGTLKFTYVQREAMDISYVVACGASNRNLKDAEITFPEMTSDGQLQVVDPTVSYDGKTLTEGRDYVIVGTVSFTEPGEYICYIRGIHNYTGLVECAYTVEEGEPVLANGTCGENLTWTLTESGVLTISGEGAMTNYTYPSYIPWYRYLASITQVAVKEGVTSLSDYAFYGCTNLKEIALPDSLESLGAVALAGTALTSVSIPTGVTSIGAEAFDGNNNLVSIQVAQENTAYSSDSFGVLFNKDKTRLIRCPEGFQGSYTIPSTVTEVGEKGFARCQNLTSVEIPGSVAVLSKHAFFACTALTSLELSEGLQVIGDEAFANCTALRGSLTFPASVTKIDSGLFGLDELDEFHFLGDMPEINQYAFAGISATVYYPGDNDTWTAEKIEACKGLCTWVAVFDKPDAPTVKASNVASTGKIKLTWNKVDGAAKYEVYRSTDKKTWTLLKTTTGTSLTNTSTTAGALYYYYVVAVAEDGTESEPSATISRTCDLARPEITLSNVASTGKIKISWNKIEGAVKYEVYRSTDNNTWSKLSTVSGTSLTNTSTEAGTLYYYKVKAIHEKESANSAYSSVKSRTCDLARPSISSLTIISSTGKIKVKWGAVDGAVKYALYCSTDNKTWTKLVTTTGTSINHNSAVAGTRYYYKVYAIASNSAANSAYSTVKDGYCDLARPTLTVSLNSKDKPVLTWNEIDGAVKYAVYRSTDNKTWTKMITTTGTKLTHSSAVSGTTYYYKVRAIASVSNANSAYSTVKSITAG